MCRPGYYQAHRERLLEQRKKYVTNNREAYMLSAAKSRAKKAGIEFNIDEGDIVIPDVCPMLGIPIIKSLGEPFGSPGSPSLDRIDNTKGYIKGNVHVVSHRANAIKRDATLDELKLIVSYLEKIT